MAKREIPLLAEPIALDEREIKLLEHVSEMMKPLLSQTLKQASGLAKWLLASLLTANAGAIVLTANSPYSQSSLALAAFALWTAGIVSALTSASVTLIQGMRMGRLLGQFMAEIAAAVSLGQLRADLVKAGDVFDTKRPMPALLIGISIMMFIAGAALMLNRIGNVS